MIKVSDIANRVGVSATTVSYVLNDSPAAARISEKTRGKILEAAEELGYRSNHFARAMRTGDTKMLGVLGGKATAENVGKMLEGALDAADAQAHTLKLLRLHAIGDSAQQAIRRSSELRLTGILALHLPELVIEELFSEARKFNTPLVLVDTYLQNPAIPQVVSDDEQGFSQSVEHLVRLGHTKIALLKGGGESSIGVARRKAFELAMAQNGLQVRPGYCQEGSFHTKERSLEAAFRLLSLRREERPTAIVCASDLMALAAIKVAHQLKLDVPSELSVVGFSNMTVGEHVDPTLTTIDQAFEEMGHCAIKMLLKLAADKNGASDGADSISSNNIRRLPTRLIARESTAPPAM